MPRRSTILTARRLRRIMTLPEVLLWQALRPRPAGLRFRRQHPIGPYVLDFYCPAARLAIEVDGIVHTLGDAPARDLRRDAWLATHGIATFRIPACEVLADLATIVTAIVDRCAGPLHRPAAGPPPHAPRGEE